MRQTLRGTEPAREHTSRDVEEAKLGDDPSRTSRLDSVYHTECFDLRNGRNNTRDPREDEEVAQKRYWIKTSPHSPRNWPTWRKWSIISGLNFYTFIVFLCLNGFVTDYYEEKFHVSTEVAILGQSMFILGVAIGPMFLAPLSETYGRQPIYCTSIALFSILQIPTVLSPTFAGIAVARFITGCFAGIPISNVGASAADLFPTSQTAWPVMLFSAFSQALGPDTGPTFGSAIYVQRDSLHWMYWSILIAGMVTFIWSLTFGETLHDKVYEKHTGIKQKKSASSAIGRELFRAFHLLFTDPIVIALALTTTYLFGLIFIYLEGYPLVYEEKTYSFNALQEGCMFLTGVGGGVFALLTQPIQNHLYRRSACSSPDGKSFPEARLYTACFAVFGLPISIFWFAFTSTHPQISFYIPLWSGFIFGYAEVAVYTGIWQYVTDAYGESAGSALAACNLPANGISAGLAHASIPMFSNLGIKWALATIGFISLPFLVVPPLIIWKGEWLRNRSRYALNSKEANDDDD